MTAEGAFLPVKVLPSIVREMRIEEREGTPIVNSRDVAEAFGKRHDHVLRDISELEIAPDLGRSWFLQRPYLDTYGREQASIDLTRNGFTILCMGWTGPKAMAFKVQYIQAFDAMHNAIGMNDRGENVAALARGLR
jgi:anti-repressor protein